MKVGCAWTFLLNTLLWLMEENSAAAVLTQQQFWFSTYGNVDYGQDESKGTHLGQRSLLECSEICSTDDYCQAVQWKLVNARKGTCYNFPYNTFNRAMRYLPGIKYFEKKNCLEPLRFTAALLYVSVTRLLVFTDDDVAILFRVEEIGTTIKLNREKKDLPSNFFPGLTGIVDAAFQDPTGNTYLVQGSQLRCYRETSSSLMSFDPCTPVPPNVLQSYFSSNSYIDALVPKDGTANEIHVFKDNVVYRLTWSGSQYSDLDNFPITEFSARNSWFNAPANLTAMSLLPSNRFLLMEESKIMIYGTQVTGFTHMC